MSDVFRHDDDSVLITALIKLAAEMACCKNMPYLVDEDNYGGYTKRSIPIARQESYIAQEQSKKWAIRVRHIADDLQRRQTNAKQELASRVPI